MTRDDLIEALAAIEHERWAHWQRWVHECGQILPDGALLLDADRVGRWTRQMATPYAELSEQEQASDRDQVMRYWPLMVAFVAAWLERREDVTDMAENWGGVFADQWREEMA